MNAKRKQIMDAAHQLFIEKGFALTSIQDILDKAGIAKGTFYNYFDSKNACLSAILQYVSEEVDQKRREIANGKEANDETVFVEQMAIRLNMSREHNLFAVFETVSFSEDAELKTFMKKQHQTEIQWMAKRLEDIYPAEAKAYTLDHAVMLIGIAHLLMHVWKQEAKKEVEAVEVIRYALARVKSMVNEQVKSKEIFLPKNWLNSVDDLNPTEAKEQVITRFKELSGKLDQAKDSKRKNYIEFLLGELQSDNPRSFLIESVLMSLEQAFEKSKHQSEVQHIINLTWKLDIGW